MCLFFVKSRKFTGVWILLISEQICVISEGMISVLAGSIPDRKLVADYFQYSTVKYV